MNKEWSLDRLYTGYDDPKFAADEAEMDSLIAEMTAYSKDLSGDPAEVLHRCIELNQKLELVVSNLYSYASLQMSTNTSDAASAAASGRFSQKLSALAAPRTALVKYVASLQDLDEVIARDELLKEHEYYLKNIKDEAEHTLSPEVEEVISLYEISGSDAWGDLQGFLTSTVPVEYNGQITTLSDIRNKAYDPDPEVRRSAYEAEIKAYDRIKDGIAYEKGDA